VLYHLASYLLVRYLVRVPVYGFRVFSEWYSVRRLRVDYPVYFLGDALLIVGMYSGMRLCVPYTFL
jgi:hypothetical protein